MACENGIEDQFFEDQFFEDSPREDDSEMNGVEEVAKEGAKANGSLNGNGHSMHADASKSNEEDAKKKMGGRKEDAGVSKDETEEDPAEKDGGGDAEMSDADEKVSSIFNTKCHMHSLTRVRCAEDERIPCIVAI